MCNTVFKKGSKEYIENEASEIDETGIGYKMFMDFEERNGLLQWNNGEAYVSKSGKTRYNVKEGSVIKWNGDYGGSDGFDERAFCFFINKKEAIKYCHIPETTIHKIKYKKGKQKRYDDIMNSYDGEGKAIFKPLIGLCHEFKILEEVWNKK